MQNPVSRSLIAAVLFLATFAACGGDDDAQEGQPTDTTPKGTATATAEPTAEGIEAEGEAFPGVPLPAGAEETGSVTYSGPEFVDLVSEGQSAQDLAELKAVTDLNTYTGVVVALFEVDASQEDLIDFYRENREGWEELLYAGPDAEDPSALLIWEREEEGRVVWISIDETTPGTSELSIFDATSVSGT